MSGGWFAALLSPRTSSSASVKNFALPGGRYSAIIALLNNNVDTRNVYPRDYLLASNELTVLTLIITWIVSLIFNRDMVINHPARWIIGGLNPCFGWDYAPANYIAVFMESFQVYLLWRYAWLEAVSTISARYTCTIAPLHENSDPSPDPNSMQARTNIRAARRGDGSRTCAETFAVVTGFLVALSSNTWLLLWLIGPPDGNWKVHTVLFLFYLSAMYLALLGNYLEADPKVVETRHTVFLFTFGAATVLLPAVYLTQGAFKDIDRKDDVFEFYFFGNPSTSFMPWWVTEAVNFFWLAQLFVVTAFTPPDKPLKLTLDLDADSDAESHTEPDRRLL